MAGHRTIRDSHRYHPEEARKVISGNGKAAKITGLPLAQRDAINDDRWTHILQTYCDYFIRY